MQTLFQTFYRLVERVSHTRQRYLYHIIDWDERLIGIKGARGVGKTTILESIYVLCLARSFKSNLEINLIKDISVFL